MKPMLSIWSAKSGLLVIEYVCPHCQAQTGATIELPIADKDFPLLLVCDECERFAVLKREDFVNWTYDEHESVYLLCHPVVSKSDFDPAQCHLRLSCACPACGSPINKDFPLAGAAVEATVFE
jgi:hypothetical protein